MKILIVKTSSLGDIIHCFPVVSYLKSRFPNSTIDWVVEKPFSELLQAHPHVDTLHIIETKKWRKTPIRYLQRMASFRKHQYDMIFDLQGNIKSSFITFFTRSPIKVGFGKKTVTEWPNLLATNRRFNPPTGKNIRDDYLYLVQSLVGDVEPFQDPGVILATEEKLPNIPKDAILVCPGSAWSNKQLGEKQLIAHLKKLGAAPLLFVWGSAEEKTLVERLQSHFPGRSQVLERLSLPTLQNVMARVSLVISMDSMPLHLAGTTSTPTYSFFGPSLGEKYSPKGPHHQFYQGSCPYGEVFTKRCSKLRSCPTGACLKTDIE